MKNKMLQIIKNGNAKLIINNAQSATFRKFFSETAIVEMKLIYANIMLDDDPDYSNLERTMDATYLVAEYAKAVIQ